MKIASYFATMFQLAIILCVCKLISAYSYNINIEDAQDNDLDLKERQEEDYYTIPSVETIWVLSLNNDDLSVRLRAANDEEMDDFELVTAPMIARMRRQNLIQLLQGLRRTTKASSTPSPLENKKAIGEAIGKNDIKQMKSDILTIINKFTMSTSQEPDTYMPVHNEATDGPSLKLFFKGPYSSLIVTLGKKLWHFFLKPSPFPAWFHEPHYNAKREGDEIYVDIPQDVEETFFKSLLRTLQKVLSYPL